MQLRPFILQCPLKKCSHPSYLIICCNQQPFNPKLKTNSGKQTKTALAAFSLFHLLRTSIGIPGLTQWTLQPNLISPALLRSKEPQAIVLQAINPRALQRGHHSRFNETLLKTLHLRSLLGVTCKEAGKKTEDPKDFINFIQKSPTKNT